MESLQQHIEHLGLALKAQFFAHPSWAYLIIILVFIRYLVGIICNKDWAVRPAGHYSGWHMIEDFLNRRLPETIAQAHLLTTCTFLPRESEALG